MEKINSFSEKISEMKRKNPGKFDHLPDPELGSAFRDWSDEEINNLRNKIRKSDLNYDNKTP
jgi:hypothetical protein